MTSSPPTHSERINAVLACLRRETTYEAVAEQFNVSPHEVQRWEARFIAGGSSALDMSSNRDLVTEMGAINAISQSIAAILNPSELWGSAIDNLFWVFGYTASISLIESEEIVVKGAYSLNGLRLPDYRLKLPLNSEKSPIAWVALKGRPLNVLDTREQPKYAQDPAIGTVRSELAMPIIFKGMALGVISVRSAQPNAFDQRDISILETIAVQLAAAIENAQLFEMVRRRINQLELVRNVTTNAIENLDVQEVLNHTVHATRGIMGYTSVAVGMLTPDGDKLALTAITDLHEEAVPEITEMALENETWIADTILSGKLNVISDIAPDSRPRPLLATSRSVLVIPIRSQGKLIGAINVESDHSAAFDDADVATMTILADQLTIAIRGAGLFQQTQAQLREISLFRRLADEAIVGILTHDAEGMIDYVNPVAVRIFGYAQPADLEGESIRTLYPAHTRREIEQHLNPNQTSRGGWSGEVTQQRQNGERFTADISVFPIHTPDGAFITYGTILSDATERHSLMNAIQQTNARFEAILEATEDAIIVWDEHWKAVLVNRAAAQLMDIPAQELIGSSRQEWQNHPRLSLVINAKESDRIDFPGNVRRFGRALNLRWQSESASGYFTVIYDVTSQVELEEAREEMTSMLVHDLRGPLTSVVGGIDLAQSGIEENEPPEQILRYLNLSAKSSALLLNMTDSLLDITKLEAGHMTLNCEPLQIEQLFDDSISVFETMAQTANISISSSHEPELPVVMGDHNMIRRALTNLLDNALKFTPNGGNIELSAQREGDTAIRFNVADSGMGIPEIYRKHIFDKYSQVPNQQGRRRGTGLGLTFCRLVAEAHHGKIWVESRPGGGSVFSFIIADPQTA